MATPDPAPLVAALAQDEYGASPGCPNRAPTTEFSGMSANTFKCPAGSADTTLWISMRSWPSAPSRCPVRSRNSANSSCERRPSGLLPSSAARWSRDKVETNASISGETCISNNHSDGQVHAAVHQVDIRTKFLTGRRPELPADTRSLAQADDSDPERVQRRIRQKRLSARHAHGRVAGGSRGR